MEVNSGRSIQSLTSQSITLKHNTRTIIEWIKTEFEWFERRQVYSITHLTINHSQTQHENTDRMHTHQTWVIWEKACLVITHCKWEYSSTPMMELYGMLFHPIEWKSIQAGLVNQSHHNHSLSNTTREQSQNASSPTLSDLREVKSSHHSL